MFWPETASRWASPERLNCVDDRRRDPVVLAEDEAAQQACRLRRGAASERVLGLRSEAVEQALDPAAPRGAQPLDGPRGDDRRDPEPLEPRRLPVVCALAPARGPPPGCRRGARAPARGPRPGAGHAGSAGAPRPRRRPGRAPPRRSRARSPRCPAAEPQRPGVDDRQPLAADTDPGQSAGAEQQARAMGAPPRLRRDAAARPRARRQAPRRAPPSTAAPKRTAPAVRRRGRRRGRQGRRSGARSDP